MNNDNYNLQLKALLHSSGEEMLTPEETAATADWSATLDSLTRETRSALAARAQPNPSHTATLALLKKNLRLTILIRRLHRILIPVAAALIIALISITAKMQLPTNGDDHRLDRLSSVLFLLTPDSDDLTGDAPIPLPPHPSLPALSQELARLQHYTSL